MPEPSGQSVGLVLGGLAVGVGVVMLGTGFAYLVTGRRTDAMDGLLFGGLALVAGCVILHRLRRNPDDGDDTDG